MIVLYYLISDIHGDLVGLKKILKKVKFNSKKDKMLILGDVLDRGKYGIDIIRFIKPYMDKGVMKCLLGNHELFCLKYLRGELPERTWSIFGGEDTIKAIKKMSTFEIEQLMVFINQLPYYEEIDTKKYGKVIATHTGIDADHCVKNENGLINVKKSIEYAMKVNQFNYMISRDLHDLPVSVLKSLDQFMIVGHVPTFCLNEDMSNKFYRCPYYMDIDSGAGYVKDGGCIGCYVLDTDEEIYLI